MSSQFIMTTNTNVRMESKQDPMESPYKYSKQTISSSNHPSRLKVTKQFPRCHYSLRRNIYIWHVPRVWRATVLDIGTVWEEKIEKFQELHNYEISEQFRFHYLRQTLFVVTIMDQLPDGSAVIEMSNMKGDEESSHLVSALHNALYLNRIVAYIDVVAS